MDELHFVLLPSTNHGKDTHGEILSFTFWDRTMGLLATEKMGSVGNGWGPLDWKFGGPSGVVVKCETKKVQGMRREAQFSLRSPFFFFYLGECLGRKKDRHM